MHRAHKSASQRRAFVKRQRARLATLQARAACTVRDTTPPQVDSADVNEATVRLVLTEDVVASAGVPGSAFTVTVNGLAWRVETVGVTGREIVLRLGVGVLAAETVEVAYAGTAGLADRAGNALPAFTVRPRNSTPAAAAPLDEPGFSPVLPKPAFADDRTFDWQPWVGEWGPKTDPYWLPSTGTLRGLIIPVDFADAPATRTVEFYRDLLGPPSQRYFTENSYGRLTLELQNVARWVRMPRRASEYASGWGSPDALRAFLADATALVDPEVDFSAVDAVYVVAPESVAGTLNLRLIRAWPGAGLVRDGRELRWSVVGGGGVDPRGPTPNLSAHHIVTHETGHFFGLPDLYDQAARGTPDQFAWAGRWDNMSDNRASAHLFAWHKWLLRWLDSKQLRGLTSPGTTQAELTPLERKGGLKAVVVRVSPDIVYVIEDRQRIGEDVELCDQGVLVWVVDGSRRNVERNAVLQPARRSFDDACGAIYDAGYDVGAGEVSTFEDANVRMEVLEALPNGNYRVRVTKK